MMSSEQPEHEVKTTLLVFLGCLGWGLYVDPDQQGDIPIKQYTLVYKHFN